MTENGTSGAVHASHAGDRTTTADRASRTRCRVTAGPGGHDITAGETG